MYAVERAVSHDIPPPFPLSIPPSLTQAQRQTGRQRQHMRCAEPAVPGLAREVKFRSALACV